MRSKVAKTGSIIILLIVAVMLINGGRLILTEQFGGKIDIDEIYESANAYDRSVGNFVLYTESNGIWTAPFIFGESLYLYSIDQDKSFLIKNSIRNKARFSENLLIYGNHVFFNQFIGEEWGPMEVVNLNKSPAYKYARNMDAIDYYSVMGDDFYSIDAVIEGEKHLGISKVNLNTNDVVNVLNEGIYYYFSLQKDWIFAYSDVDNSITAKSLSKSDTWKYYYEQKDPPGPIEAINDRMFFTIGANSGEVTVYNMQDKSSYSVATFNYSKQHVKNGAYNAYQYVEGNIYFYDCGSKIYRMNLKNKDSELVIDFSTSVDNLLSARVSYCTDYIVAEVVSSNNQNFQKKKLLIFNYAGKLITEKELHSSKY